MPVKGVREVNRNFNKLIGNISVNISVKTLTNGLIVGGAVSDRITPGSIHRSFFLSSGAEANEGALKLAHRATGRARFLATLGSFHGRTLGVMGVLGQEKYRARWSRIINEARFAPYGDLPAAESALDGAVAALIVAPVQGEGGVLRPSEG